MVSEIAIPSLDEPQTFLRHFCLDCAQIALRKAEVAGDGSRLKPEFYTILGSLPSLLKK
jgi:hypothetical protein